MIEDENSLELVAYVRASNHRKNIIKFLSHGMNTPKEIGVALDVRTNHISNILSDLKDRDLVFCATPNVRKGRLYKLTEKGESILKYL